MKGLLLPSLLCLYMATCRIHTIGSPIGQCTVSLAGSNLQQNLPILVWKKNMYVPVDGSIWSACTNQLIYHRNIHHTSFALNCGSIPTRSKICSLLQQHPDRLWSPFTLLLNRHVGCEADHSSLFSAEVRNE